MVITQWYLLHLLLYVLQWHNKCGLNESPAYTESIKSGVLRNIPPEPMTSILVAVAAESSVVSDGGQEKPPRPPTTKRLKQPKRPATLLRGSLVFSHCRSNSNGL